VNPTGVLASKAALPRLEADMSPVRLRSAACAVLLGAGAVFARAATPSVTPSPAHEIEGTVFEDLNANGQRDAGEPGLPGVEVSDGATVVLTGPNGHYRIAAARSDLVFVIKPRGWRPLLDVHYLPRDYVRLPDVAATSSKPTLDGPIAAASILPPPETAAVGRADFALVRNPESDDLKMLVFTDPQPASLREVGYLARGLVDGLVGQTDAAFGVTLGDVVYDRPDLFEAVNAIVARLRLPWFNLPGNHDLALTPGDDRQASAAFAAVYGPTTYAFHWGPALFVALDDVRPLGGPRFIGGLRPDQFAFLEALLNRSPPSEWVVLMAHIPLAPPDPFTAETFRPADRARLFALLQGRPRLLVLSGHTHDQRHFFYGAPQGWPGAVPLHEYNVAAACGGFWGGPPDEQGVPVATMWDGTPPGYGLLTFHDGAVDCDYRPARFPADRQMALHAPRAVAVGAGYVSFYANVFNGHAGWTVEARVDDHAWQPMRLQPGWDPSFAEAFLAQDAGERPGATPRLPDPVICYHLWRAYFPADLSPGPHWLEVRATDPAGKVYQTAQPFHAMPL